MASAISGHSSFTHSSMPSKNYDEYWIFARAPFKVESRGQTYGKWLIFKNIAEIDQVWEEVKKQVESGDLLATGAKVSTMKDNPNAQNPDQKVICVYTTYEDIDEVGMKLVQVVRQTIRYKSDEATLAGLYANRGCKKVTMRTINWKDGKASFK